MPVLHMVLVYKGRHVIDNCYETRRVICIRESMCARESGVGGAGYTGAVRYMRKTAQYKCNNVYLAVKSSV